MKKTDAKNKKTKGRNEELRHINSELGSFGLEPPKRYREDQYIDQRWERQAKSNKKTSAKKYAVGMSDNQKQMKNKKKRRKKSKLRKVIFVSVIGISIVVVTAIALVAFGFKIDTIKVTDNKKYTEDQVLAVLPVEKEDSLFLFDKNSVCEKLEKNLPYIYDVQISRKLPSTLVVKIIEPSYVYYVKNSDNSYTYLDDNFKILEVGAKKKAKKGIEIKNLAISNSVAGEKAQFTNKKIEKQLKPLTQAIKEYKLHEITALYSDSITSNYLVYENRLLIKLGDCRDLENKIFTALAAIEKLNESNPSAHGTITSTGGKQIYFTEDM